MDKILNYINCINSSKSTLNNYYKNLMLAQVTELLKNDISLKEVFHQIHLQNEKILINLSVDFTCDSVPLHSHIFYEIIFVLNGTVDYIIETNYLSLQKGDIVIIPPGIAHQPLIFDQLKEPYQRFSLWIDTSYLNEIFNKYPDVELAFKKSKNDKKYLIRTNETIWRNLRTPFENIYRESTEMKPGWKLCIIYETLSLITKLSRIYYNNDILNKKSENITLMESVLAYINTNLSEKITLRDIAEYFHISESKISHMFQEQIGISFYQCVIQRRLIATKNAIFQGLSLKEASYKCGFSEYSSFYRLFKKEYGISPKEYFKIQQSLMTGSTNNF